MSENNKKMNVKEYKPKPKILVKPIIKKLESSPEIVKNLQAVFNSQKVKDQLKNAVNKLQADDALPLKKHTKPIRPEIAKSKLKISDSVKETLRSSILQKNANNIKNDNQQNNTCGKYVIGNSESGTESENEVGNMQINEVHKLSTIDMMSSKPSSSSISNKIFKTFNTNGTNSGNFVDKKNTIMYGQKETQKGKMSLNMTSKRNIANQKQIKGTTNCQPKEITGQNLATSSNELALENNSKVQIEVDPLNNIVNYKFSATNIKPISYDKPDIKIQKASINIEGKQTRNYKVDILDKRILNKEDNISSTPNSKPNILNKWANHPKKVEKNVIFKSPENPQKNKIEDINIQDIFLINEIEEYNNQHSGFVKSEENFNIYTQSINGLDDQTIITFPLNSEPEYTNSSYVPTIYMDSNKTKPKSIQYSPKLIQDLDSNIILQQKSIPDFYNNFDLTNSFNIHKQTDENPNVSNVKMPSSQEFAVDAVDFLCNLNDNFVEMEDDEDDDTSDASSNMEDSEILRPEEFVKIISNSSLQEAEENKNISQGSSKDVDGDNFNKCLEKGLENALDKHSGSIRLIPIVIENKVLSDDEKFNLNLCLGGVVSNNNLNKNLGSSNTKISISSNDSQIYAFESKIVSPSIKAQIPINIDKNQISDEGKCIETTTSIMPLINFEAASTDTIILCKTVDENSTLLNESNIIQVNSENVTKKVDVSKSDSMIILKENNFHNSLNTNENIEHSFVADNDTNLVQFNENSIDDSNMDVDDNDAISSSNQTILEVNIASSDQTQTNIIVNSSVTPNIEEIVPSTDQTHTNLRENLSLPFNNNKLAQLKPKAIPISSRRPCLRGSKINLVQRRKGSTKNNNISIQPDSEENPAISPHFETKDEIDMSKNIASIEQNNSNKKNLDFVLQINNEDCNKIEILKNIKITEKDNCNEKILEDKNDVNLLDNAVNSLCNNKNTIENKNLIQSNNEICENRNDKLEDESPDILLNSNNDHADNMHSKSNEIEENEEFINSPERIDVVDFVESENELSASETSNNSQFNGFDLSSIKIEEYSISSLYNNTIEEVNSTLSQLKKEANITSKEVNCESLTIDIVNDCVTSDILTSYIISELPSEVSSENNNNNDISCKKSIKKRSNRSLSSTKSISETEESKSKDNKIKILQKHAYFSSRKDSETSTTSDHQSTSSPRIENTIENSITEEHTVQIDDHPVKIDDPSTDNKQKKRKKKQNDNISSSDKPSKKIKHNDDMVTIKKGKQTNKQTVIDESLITPPDHKSSISVNDEIKLDDLESLSSLKKKISSSEKSPKQTKDTKLKKAAKISQQSKKLIESFQKYYAELLPDFEKRRKRKTPAANSSRKLHPNLLLINNRSEIDNFRVKDVTLASNEDKIVCGLCKETVLRRKVEWTDHLCTHYGVGWIEGDNVVDVTQYNWVLSVMINFMKITNCKALKCRMCQNEYKSALGTLTHILICGLNHEEKRNEAYHLCEHCNNQIHYLSFSTHVKNCSAQKNALELQNDDNLMNDSNAREENEIVSNTGRLKRKSTVKAEHKFKELEKNCADINVSNCIQLTYALRGGIYRNWKKKIIAGGKVKCCGENCDELFDDFDALKKHVINCPKIIRMYYICIICKYKNEHSHEVKEHVLRQHQKDLKNTNMDDSESEVEFSKKDLSSSSEECSSGVDEFEIHEEVEEIQESDESQSPTKKKGKKFDKSNNSRILNCVQKSKFLFSVKRNSFSKISRETRNWTKFFISNHFSSETLFSYCLPHCKPCDNIKRSDYEPMNNLSMKFSFSNIETNSHFGSSKPTALLELDVFKTLRNKTELLLFIGGPITSVQWIPLPDSISCKTQYLAISYKSNYNKFTRVINQKSHKTLILIHKIQTIEQNFNEISNLNSTSVESNFDYGIICDYGPVHDMKFIPSGGYDTSINRLGLLAVANVDSNVNIYSLPIEVQQNDCDTFSDGLKLIQLKPIMKLTINFGIEDNDLIKQQKDNYFVQCHRIAWSKSKGHTILATGYANGCVAIWNIDNDCNLNCFKVRDDNDDEILHFTPISYFRVSDKFITSLDLHYNTNEPRWLIASSHSRVVRIYDIENPSNPILLLDDISKSFVTSGNWPIIWENSIVGASSDLCSPGPVAISPMQILYLRRRCALFPSGVTCLDFNPWNNVSIFGTENGDFSLEFRSEYNLDCTLRRYMHVKMFTYTDLIRLDGSEHPTVEPAKETNINTKNKKVTSKNVKPDAPEVSATPVTVATNTEPLKFFDKDYRNKYGLVFGPINFNNDINHVYQSEKRCPPFNLSYYVRVNAVACNLNFYGSNLYTLGYENGFVRILYQKIPNNL